MIKYNTCFEKEELAEKCPECSAHVCDSGGDRVLLRLFDDAFHDLQFVCIARAETHCDVNIMSLAECAVSVQMRELLVHNERGGPSASSRMYAFTFSFYQNLPFISSLF